MKKSLIVAACVVSLAASSLSERHSDPHVDTTIDTASFLVISPARSITGDSDALRETAPVASEKIAFWEGYDFESRFRSLPDYRDWWLSPAALHSLGCHVTYSPQQILQRKSLNLKFGDFKSYTGRS